MAKKKIEKWQRDIAAAQAISASSQNEVTRDTPIERSEWWLRLSKSSTQEQIRAVLNTPMLPDITDEDASKTVED